MGVVLTEITAELAGTATPPVGCRFARGWPAPFWEETLAAVAGGRKHRAWYVLRPATRVVGVIGASDIGGAVAKVGYGIVNSQQGRGNATAALRALIAELCGNGFERVIAETFVDHADSRRVMEKAGMHEAGTRKEEADGVPCELVVYQIECARRRTAQG